MTQSTSSAEPEKLFRYSDFGLQLDHELISEAGRLSSSLRHFEHTCTEPGFRMSVAQHADSLGSHGTQCESLDSWVGTVGRGFQAADSVGLGTVGRGFPTADLGRLGGALRSALSWLPLAWNLSWIGIPWPLSLVWLITIPPWIKEALKNPHWLLKGLQSEPLPISAQQVDSLGKDPLAKPQMGEPLLQANLQGDVFERQIKRANPKDENGNISYYTTTIGDDIAQYGCLITCFTMLLRDRGKDVSVDDLYIANYNLKGGNFEEDVELNLLDMYAEPGLVELIAPDSKVEIVKFPPNQDPGQSVVDAIQSQPLPVILHVDSPKADGHYIIVDGINPDGTFRVRDPLEGLVENATIGTSGEEGRKYTVIAGDRSI